MQLQKILNPNKPKPGGKKTRSLAPGLRLEIIITVKLLIHTTSHQRAPNNNPKKNWNNQEPI
jgi:hypothetical protein